MERLKIRFTGTTPLMVHNARLSNPIDPLVKEIKKITSKRKKTDEDHEAIAWLEWQGGLYWNAEIGPYLPASYFRAHLIDAAKNSKRGQAVKRGVTILDLESPIKYQGPRTPTEMYEAGKFVDVRSVKVGVMRIMRCRPIFPEWSVEFSLAFNATILDADDFNTFFDVGGTLLGIGESRPAYGRYDFHIVG